MRKCRNWQTSKTKDLVINAIVWVQVPSSAVRKSLEIKGFFLFHKKVTIQVTKKRRNCNCVYDIAVIMGDVYFFLKSFYNLIVHTHHVK